MLGRIKNSRFLTRQISSWLAWIFIAISLIGIVFAWWLQVDDIFFGKDRLKQVTTIGDHCEFQTGVVLPQSFNEVLAAPKNLQPTLLPFRRTGETPILPDSGYVYVKCVVNLAPEEPLMHGHYVVMNLGRLYGKSAVYLSGKLRGVYYENDTSEFPLLPEDKDSKAVLEIVSFKDSVNQTAGPATLLPLYVADSTKKIRAVQLGEWFSRIQRPAFMFGWTLGLFVLFFFVWISGARYNDVAWIIVYAGTIAGMWTAGYAPMRVWERWQDILVPVFRYGAFASFAPLLYSFFRIETKSVKPEYFAVFVMVLVAILRVTMPEAAWRNFGMWDHVPSVVAALACLLPGIHGFRHSRTIVGPRRVRILIVSVVALVSCPGYLVQSWLMKKYLVNIEPFMTVGLLTMMAAFLIEDLVKFQGLYLKDQDQRRKDVKEKALIRESLELGLEVQKLILPREQSVQSKLTNHSWYFKPAMGVSGDWIQVWANAQYEVFWLGDVVGKGTQAALAVTLVTATIKRYDRKTDLDPSDTVRECIHEINRILRESFDGFINTTLSALIVKNGKAEVFNCGGAGFSFSGNGVTRKVTPQGSLVGIGDQMVIGTVEVEFSPGMVAVSYSDGVIEGSRSTKAFLDLLPTLAKSSHSEIFEAASKMKTDVHGVDDMSMIVVSKA